MKVLLHFLLILFLVGFSQAATINGQVTDSLSGVPVTGAKITAVGFTSDTADSLLFMAKSNDDGKFTLENLPAGKYYLMCQHPDYFKSNYQEIGLEEGDVKRVLFLLEPFTGIKKPAVKGFVYSAPPMLPALIPIEDAVVYIKGRQVEDKTSTSSDGAYWFESLPPGKYLIWAEARGHLAMEHPDTIEIKDSDQILRHNFHLIPEDQSTPVYLVGGVYDATVNTPDYPCLPCKNYTHFKHPLVYAPVDTVVFL